MSKLIGAMPIPGLKSVKSGLKPTHCLDDYDNGYGLPVARVSIKNINYSPQLYALFIHYFKHNKSIDIFYQIHSKAFYFVTNATNSE